MKPKKPFIVRKQYRSPRFNLLDEKAVSMYEDDMLSLKKIAKHYDCTPQAVHKYLKRRGVDTRKRKWEVPCTYCGKPILRQRNWIRRQRRHYCNQECYRNHLRDPRYTRKPAQTPNQRALDIMRELGM